MSKKKRPSTVPRSEADVQRAYREGAREGLKLGLDITLHALMCDMEQSEEFLERFNHYYNSGLASVKAGKKVLTKEDIRRNLLEERNLEVVEV